MADISQVKLPDGTTYNLKDSYVRTNYRALSNNDFDTINVTELNAGDLIVTGAARFLNTINGNAATATKATQDESGNNIKATYAASFSISDHTITLKNKNGVSLGTVTVPDNNDNTWRKVQVNGTDILGTATNTNPLNLKAGTNVNLSNSSGTVTITATDTNTTYTIGTSGNTITLTPSSGSVQSITVPYATTATTATTASKLGSSNVGSATNPIYLASGTATACTYSLNKTVPSDAVFTDQYVSQSATTTSDYRKIVLSYQNGAAGAAVTSNTNVVYVTANAEIQPSTGNIRSAGTVSATNLSATTNVTGVTLGVATTAGTTGGICLYGGAGNTTSYGIAMRTTANSGKHGYVQGDWGTYFYMAGATNRGWVFVNAGSGNRASISTEGNMVLNGSLTVGGNTTNTSGVRQVYNETTKSLDFVFVA